jgi:hypothetical protein
VGKDEGKALQKRSGRYKGKGNRKRTPKFFRGFVLLMYLGVSYLYSLPWCLIVTDNWGSGAALNVKAWVQRTG